jgi:hypothetical protein
MRPAFKHTGQRYGNGWATKPQLRETAKTREKGGAESHASCSPTKIFR